MVTRVKRKDAGTAKAAAVCRGSGSSPLGVMRILRMREFLVMMEVPVCPTAPPATTTAAASSASA